MDEEAELRLRIAVQILTMIYTVWTVWMVMVPPHQRQLLRMRALAAARTTADRIARRAGEASMGAELSTGHENYVLPYRLSRARDALGRAYDRARGVTP